MASLMAPTVEPSAGITQRLNSFESDLSPIRESHKEVKNSLGQFNQIAKTAMQFQLEAHNAANEAKLTDYSLRLQKAHADILNDLKTKTNKDAIDAREGVMQSFSDIQDKLAQELSEEDPYVINGFKQRAQQTLYNSQTHADAYVIEQSIRYRDTQRAAQVENLGEQMALHMDNPVMYSKAMEDFRAARAQQDDELGIEAGSDISKVMDRKVTDSIYSSEITKLIGLKKFGNADRMLKNAKGNEFINANTYNKAIVDLFAAREAAARQAEIDAQRRARFKSQQAKDAWDIKNAMAKNELLKLDYTKKELQMQYGPLSEAEKNAYEFKLIRDMEASDAFKEREIEEIDPETGQKVLKTVQLDAETRNKMIRMSAAKAANQFETSRNARNTAVQLALNTVADAAASGHGDSTIAKAVDAYESMPDGAEKDELGEAIGLIRQEVPESDLEARVQYKMDRSYIGDTAKAKEYIHRRDPSKIPTRPDGQVDIIKLRDNLAKEGISNYEATEIRADAQKLIDSSRDKKNQVYTTPGFAQMREVAAVSVGAGLVENGLLDDERISFNSADAKSRDAKVRERYTAGQYASRKVIEEFESRVASILDPAERQSRFLQLISSHEAKELMVKYGEEYYYDRNLMSVDELNAYDEKRINKWRGNK